MHFAVFQIWGLGDLTMTTPVISEFRRLHPDSKLTLIVGGQAQAALMEGSLLVDQILVVPSGSSRRTMAKFLLDLRRQDIDVVFIGTRITTGTGRRIPWALKGLSGISVIIGDADARRYRYPYSICNTIDPAEHRVDRMLSTFALWSRQPPAVPRFSIATNEGAVREATSLLAGQGLSPRRFVVLHPGSSGGPKQTVKRIPVDVALRIADSIVRSREDLSIAFMFGPEDVGLIPHFQALGPRQFVVAGCSLPTTVAVISQAAGFIGSDSGLGHIAAALDVPTITLIGPTVPSETAPYGARATAIQRAEKLECQPCWFGPLQGRCPYGIRCMHELPEADIVMEVMAWGAPSSDTLP